MRSLCLLPAGLVLLFLAACGGGTTITDDVSGPPPPLSFDAYVDAVNGDDGGAGTLLDPYKTLTHALAVSSAGDRIRAFKGVYDAANGEFFPLNIPAGVTLIGDEVNRGAGDPGTCPASTTKLHRCNRRRADAADSVGSARWHMNCM